MLSEGVNKIIWRKKNSYGYPQPKVGKSQEFSSMGCLKIFWVKGKKPQVGGGRPAPPTPMDKRVKRDCWPLFQWGFHGAVYSSGIRFTLSILLFSRSQSSMLSRRERETMTTKTLKDFFSWNFKLLAFFIVSQMWRNLIKYLIFQCALGLKPGQAVHRSKVIETNQQNWGERKI